jgi:hypothetical protein
MYSVFTRQRINKQGYMGRRESKNNEGGAYKDNQRDSKEQPVFSEFHKFIKMISKPRGNG